VGVRIESLTADGARGCLADLVAVLTDSVDGGASVGFLPPLDPDDARAYWQSVADAVADGTRVLVAARRAEDGALVGTAQLGLETRANGRHRAEVMKVLVLSRARRQGIGRALMDVLEREARRRGRTTLVLDTRAGDPSERLYVACGWTRAGAIPKYAQSAGGGVDASAFYYRLLDPIAGASSTEGGGQP
jgi:acetyltransferase